MKKIFRREIFIICIHVINISIDARPLDFGKSAEGAN